MTDTPGLFELTKKIFHKTCTVIASIVSWWLWCQKEVSRAGISNYIPQFTVGCDYLSLSDWDACFWCQCSYLTKWKYLHGVNISPSCMSIALLVSLLLWCSILSLLIRVNEGDLLSPRPEYHLMILITIDVVFYNNRGPENGCSATKDIRKWLSEWIKQKNGICFILVKCTASKKWHLFLAVDVLQGMVSMQV